MNRLKRVMLLGAAISVLGAAYASGACKRDYDTPPVDPTHIASPTATPTQSIDDIVTVTPESTPTATPEATKVPATATPLPLADLVFDNVRHTAGEWGKIIEMAELIE